MVKIIIPPDPLVSLDDVKTALGESGTDRDDLIETLMMAAQSELDGPNGWVGISVAQQMGEVKASSFDCPAIRLPGGPVIAATIAYLDADGADQTIPDANCFVSSDGTLSLAAGASWPALSDQSEAVTVTYEVGIDDPDDPRCALMKTAIILHVRMTLDGIEPEKSRKAIESLVRSMWVPVM